MAPPSQLSLLMSLLGILQLALAADWAAIFLGRTEHRELPGFPSSADIAADHLTLQYGGDLSHFAAEAGKHKIIQILAFAHDDHAQTVLAVPADDGVVSENPFSHVTISSQGDKPPYDPFYSNLLWQRLAANVPLTIVRDAVGMIASVGLPGAALSWAGELPANGSFPATAATVTLVAVESVYLEGTICLRSHWNDTRRACVKH